MLFVIFDFCDYVFLYLFIVALYYTVLKVADKTGGLEGKTVKKFCRKLHVTTSGEYLLTENVPVTEPDRYRPHVIIIYSQTPQLLPLRTCPALSFLQAHIPG